MKVLMKETVMDTLLYERPDSNGNIETVYETRQFHSGETYDVDKKLGERLIFYGSAKPSLC